MGKKKTKTKADKEVKPDVLVPLNLTKGNSPSVWNTDGVIPAYISLPVNTLEESDALREKVKEEDAINEALIETEIPAIVDDPEIVNTLKKQEIITEIPKLNSAGFQLDNGYLSSIGFEPEFPIEVYVHTDLISIFLCEVLNARAFTLGKHIYFNEGEFDPEKKKNLLLHELTHLLEQQSKGKKIQRQTRDLLKEKKSRLAGWVPTDKEIIISLTKVLNAAGTKKRLELFEKYPALKNALYPFPDDRKDIVSIYAPFDEAKASKYWIKEVYKKFKEKNANIDNSILNQWIRKNLKLGWMIYDEAPSIKATIIISENPLIVEAYSFDDAWGMAEKKLKPNQKFYWRHKISGKDDEHYLVYGSNEAYSNLKNNEDGFVDFQLLSIIGNDTYNYQKVIAIKNYRNQLLSENLVLLVLNAQRVVYPYEPSKQTGIYTQELYKELHTHKKFLSEIAAEKKTKLNQLRTTGIPDPVNPKRQVFLVKQLSGQEVEISVDHVMLQNIQTVFKSDDKDAIVDLVNSWLEQKTKKPSKELLNILMVLKINERKKLLDAFLNEYYLYQEEESIVNKLIATTPPDQTAEFKKFLFDKDEDRISALNDLVENKETKKEFYASIESGANVVYTKNVNDLIAEIDKPTDVNKAIALLDSMTDQQNNQLDYAHRLKLIKRLTSSYKSNVRILLNIPNDQRRLIADYFKENQFKQLYKYHFNIDDEQKESLRVAFGQLFEADYNEYKRMSQSGVQFTKSTSNNAVTILFSLVRYGSQNGTETELLLQALPDNLLKTLDNDLRIQFIQHFLLDLYLDGDDEEAILRVLKLAGMNERGEKDALITRQNLYFKLNPKSDNGLLSKISRGFKLAPTGNNYDQLLRTVNELNPVGAESRIKEVDDTRSKNEDSFYDTQTDDAIGKLTHEDMKTLSFEKRKEYIQYILGQNTQKMYEYLGKVEERDPGSIRDRMVSRVGASDEASLLMLLNTTPGAEIPMLLSWLQKNDGAYYNQLDFSIDGENFQELHKSLQDAAANKLLIEIQKESPEVLQQNEQMIVEMEQLGWKHSKVVPWSDPGIVDVRAEHNLSYSVGWENDQIVVSYQSIYTDDPEFSTEKSKTFDPWEMIGIHFLRDEPSMQAKKGEVRIVPAIYLFELENKQTNQTIGEVSDVASVFIGVYELKAAVSFTRTALAVADITLSATDLLVISYEDTLPKELLEIWHSIYAGFAAYMMGKVGYLALKGIAGKVNDIWTWVSNNIKNISIKLFYASRIKVLNRFLDYAAQLETASLEELTRLRSEMDEFLEAGKLTSNEAEKLRTLRDRLVEKIHQKTAEEFWKNKYKQETSTMGDETTPENREPTSQKTEEEIPYDTIPKQNESPTITFEELMAEAMATLNLQAVEGAAKWEQLAHKMAELGIAKGLFKNGDEFAEFMNAQKAVLGETHPLYNMDMKGVFSKTEDSLKSSEFASVSKSDAFKLGLDAQTLNAMKWLKPKEGYIDVFIHGTPDYFVVSVGERAARIDHRSLAKYLRANGYKGGKIRLVSCNSGVNVDGIAQHLSNKLGVEIEAPTSYVTVYEDGSHIIHDGGRWKTFNPGEASFDDYTRMQREKLGWMEQNPTKSNDMVGAKMATMGDPVNEVKIARERLQNFIEEDKLNQLSSDELINLNKASDETLAGLSGKTQSEIDEIIRSQNQEYSIDIAIKKALEKGRKRTTPPNYSIGESLLDDEVLIFARRPTENTLKIRKGIDDMPIQNLTQRGKSVSIGVTFDLTEELRNIFGTAKTFDKTDRIYAITAKEIREAGFEVVYAKTSNNLWHSRIIESSGSFDNPESISKLIDKMKLIAQFK